MKRPVDPFLSLVLRSSESRRDPHEVDPASEVLPRYQAWRLRALALVVLLTGLIAAMDTYQDHAPQVMVGEPGSFALELGQPLGSEPDRRTTFGRMADLAWDLTFYAMPASALLAAGFWARPRWSRWVLAAGWGASFLLPVIIALLPWSWWELPTTAQPVGPFARIQERVAWGAYYFGVLSPSVLSLVPGVIRACLRVKRLLPGAVLPGWLLMAAAPFNGLLALVAFVSLAQVAPGPLLLTGMFLWLAAPLTFLARADLYMRPISTAGELRGQRRARTVAWSLAIAAAGCLLVYATTWEAFGFRLVGVNPQTSLIRPWQVVRYVLDFSGRSLFVTVLASDFLLRATISAWRHQREFAFTPAAAEFDRMMERLDAGTRMTG